MHGRSSGLPVPTLADLPRDTRGIGGSTKQGPRPRAVGLGVLEPSDARPSALTGGEASLDLMCAPYQPERRSITTTTSSRLPALQRNVVVARPQTFQPEAA